MVDGYYVCFVMVMVLNGVYVVMMIIWIVINLLVWLVVVNFIDG